MTMPRVEVITSVERRRWSREEKERLVAASLEPDVSVSEVARSAGIHVSQLFRWRKDLCDRVDAGSSQLVPVEIAPAAAMPPAVEAPAPSASPVRRHRKSGIIEIELGGGHRVRVDRDVDAERALRGLAVGRKYWLFAGSDRGADRAAVMYTLIGTATLHDVDPQVWLADVLSRIADTPQGRLAELLPWNWKAQTARLAA